MNKPIDSNSKTITDEKSDIAFMDPIVVKLFNLTTCTLFFASEDLTNDTGRFKPFPPGRIEINTVNGPGVSWALMQDDGMDYGADAVIRYVVEDGNWGARMSRTTQ